MLHGRWVFGAMTRGRCHGRRKMMGRSANGGCGTEEKHCPISTSRVPTKFLVEEKDAPLAGVVGVDFYAQACKALAVLSPFDLEDGQKKSSSIIPTLPGGLASYLSKHSDSRKRHKKSHLGSETKKNKASLRQEKPRGVSIWSETEDYFRELRVDDIERLNEESSFRGSKFFSIPYPGNNMNGSNNHKGVIVTNEQEQEQEVDHFMEVDGVGANEISQDQQEVCANEISQDQQEDRVNEISQDQQESANDISQHQQEDCETEISQHQQENDDVCTLPQFCSGVEWLLGSRNKVYLTSERPSKKRKLLGGEAGLEKLFVTRPVREQGPSRCCHYCSLGDTGNQLNRLIVCTSCGVAVHQRCYGVQQDDEAGCWLCSWCRRKRDEGKSSDSYCVLCPQQGGALKPVRKRGAGNDEGGLIEFAHLFCSQWMPEVYIEDTKSMEPIMNIEGIKDTQRKLICYLCKVKCGACVRCSHGACRTSFHPVCAREARHRMEIWGKFGCDDVELRAFCSKHSEAQKDCRQQVESLSATVTEHRPLSCVVNEPHKLKIIRKTGDRFPLHTEATDLEMERRGGSASLEDGSMDARSNLKRKLECINGPEPKGSSTVEKCIAEDVKVSDSSNFTLLLKKLVERGKVNLKDVASEINVSPNLLASNLADDCLPLELHGKIVKWLKSHAHIGMVQKPLKLKVMSTCISKAEKESGVENAIRASENNGVNSPAKSAVPRRKNKGNIRMMKDNNLILSFKRNSGDDGVVMNEDKNGGLICENRNCQSEESSPDSREKLSVESCGASDLLAGNYTNHKGDPAKCSSPSHYVSGQTDEAIVSKCDTMVKSNLGSNDCSVAISDNPDAIRAEASPGSYVHPLILLQNHVLSEIKAEEDDGSRHRQVSLMEASSSSGACCKHQIQSSSTELSCEAVNDLGETKRSIINMSPIDEVEGELVYYQHKLLCNIVARKHLSDALISRVVKYLPQEIDTLRKHNWDAVLISQYLSELREVKKQGRKERRHKEAQAVLAAATAAAAASSRLSSFRKDAVDESALQENTLKIKAFGGRSALHAQQNPRAKEILPKLSVTWTSPEKNFDSSPSTLDYKVHSRVCDVCSRAETLLNPIIVCSSCKVAVHINCYRSVKDSTGPWYCELCEDLISSRSRGVASLNYSEKPCHAAECSICGGSTGAFRKSTDGQWIHAFCAEWVLESTFRRGQAKPVEGMETVSRGNDLCLICNRKLGVCIKCNYGHCQSSFHPSCGRSAGFFMNVRTSSGKIQHKAYCEKHSLVERTKAETQKHGVEEWNSLKKVRVELERLRLICERIIRREKLKRELVLCSHDMLRWNRELISSSSTRPFSSFVSPDVSSESATTSLRGYVNSNKSCSETIQRSDDITIDSTVAGKRRIRFPMAMDNDQKTDDSSTSQIFTQIPTVRPILSGKQIPHRPLSAVSRSMSDDGDKFFRHGKHTETFEKELVMTSDQASMRNQRLPKGFVYVPIRCLPNDEETLAAATATAAAAANASSEENSEHDD